LHLLHLSESPSTVDEDLLRIYLEFTKNLFRLLRNTYL
jgi:hypothetical protein